MFIYSGWQCAVTYVLSCIHTLSQYDPLQPSEFDTLSVAVAVDETLPDGEVEGSISVDGVEGESRDGEHQAETRNEAEQSCQDQEECSTEHNGEPDPKELSSIRHRIPCSQRCAASAGIWSLHVLLDSFHLLNLMVWERLVFIFG